MNNRSSTLVNVVISQKRACNFLQKKSPH
jgi:hypothetical protein